MNSITYIMLCPNESCTQGEFTIEQSMKDSLPTQCHRCSCELVQVFKGTRVIWNDKDICGKINKS